MNGIAASRWRVLYHLARADFLERVRRYSFLFTLAMTVYFGYLAATGRIMLRLGNMRGMYNSAWIGALMSLVVTTFLSLAGFYVVKNTIERDRATRVGQILASTPMSKLLYVIGKVLSNFAVLGVMVAILALSGGVMQLLQGEDRHIELWKLLAPFLLLALPAMAVVAAVAVLFETIPLLRGGFGNVVYCFAWIMGLTLPAVSGMKGIHLADWSGLSVIWDSVAAGAKLSPENSGFSFSLDVGSFNFVKSTFQWDGVNWTVGIILDRLFWLVFALTLAFFAALLFDRFDTARGKPLRERLQLEPDAVREIDAEPVRAPAVVLAPLPAGPLHFRFGAMLAAELRLMLKGQKWWWYGVALAFAVACAAVPSAEGRGILLGCAWIWPVLLWSAMGVREAREQTSQILFSAPHPIARQLPAVWLAGFVLAALTGSGFALRLLAAGNIRGLLAWLIGALFIPTFALSLGVWSGSSKPFEILYTLLWYVGPMHAMPPLDFMGSAPATATSRYPLMYLIVTCALIVVSLAGRKRQLQT
jgi:hypothetical protein